MHDSCGVWTHVYKTTMCGDTHIYNNEAYPACPSVLQHVSQSPPPLTTDTQGSCLWEGDISYILRQDVYRSNTMTAEDDVHGARVSSLAPLMPPCTLSSAYSDAAPCLLSRHVWDFTHVCSSLPPCTMPCVPAYRPSCGSLGDRYQGCCHSPMPREAG